MATKQEIFHWIKTNLPKTILNKRIQSIKDIDYSFIKPMFNKSILFKSEDYFIEKHKEGINGQCFYIASYIWMKKHKNINNLKLCIGLARSDRSSKFYWHSWLVHEDKKILIEPTNIIRKDYWGVCLNREQSVNFIKERLELIACLNVFNKKYRITNKMLIDLL